MNQSGFTAEEAERYSRHFALPEVGLEGQAKLKAARVLIVGAGGLGSPVGLYLAAAGVGTIGIVDFDTVLMSNLQRQVLYSSDDIGRKKALVASERLTALNPGIRILPYAYRLDSTNALGILAEYQIIADCSDNFATRYLVNDACVLARRINVYASVFRFEGLVTVCGAATGPCYRCLHPVPPSPDLVQDCSEAGVLGVLPGIVGALQANEIIKLILSKGRTLTGRLLMFDALTATTQEIVVKKDPSCPVCGDTPNLTSLIDYEEFCVGGPSSHRIASDFEITVMELKRSLDRKASITLLDVREPYEHKICALGEQLIPLGELEQRRSELNASSEFIVYCHHGIRSEVAAALLRRSGFQSVKTLVGGIDAWAREVDRAMPRY